MMAKQNVNLQEINVLENLTDGSYYEGKDENICKSILDEDDSYKCVLNDHVQNIRKWIVIHAKIIINIHQVIKDVSLLIIDVLSN